MPKAKRTKAESNSDAVMTSLVKSLGLASESLKWCAEIVAIHQRVVQKDTTQAKAWQEIETLVQGISKIFGASLPSHDTSDRTNSERVLAKTSKAELLIEPTKPRKAREITLEGVISSSRGYNPEAAKNAFNILNSKKDNIRHDALLGLTKSVVVVREIEAFKRFLSESANKKGALPKSVLNEFVLPLASVMKLATAAFDGNQDSAKVFLTSSSTLLKNRIPIVMCFRGQGDEVISFLKKKAK